MTLLKVSIGQFEHRSDDNGRTWIRSLRQIPPKNAPVLCGDIDPTRLPHGPQECYWDFATMLSTGFGVVVGHENLDGDRSIAKVFVTNDGGNRWRQQHPKLTLPFLRRVIHRICLSEPSWPVERFASLVVTVPNCFALAWDDPWLFEGPRSHVICTEDQGESWVYHCLGYTSPYLAADNQGRLLALNDGFFLESFDGGTTWDRLDFQVDWPEDYDRERVALLRHVTFTTAGIAFALVVHWPQGRIRDLQPNVGLLRTTDNGLRWAHTHVFDGPDIGDVNERHMIGLQVF